MEVGGPAIGIDLGNTNLCAAIWQQNRIEIISFLDNRRTPSYVSFDDAGCLIGEGAKNQRELNPANTIFDVRQLIGRRFSDAKVQENIKLLPYKVIKGANDTPKIVVTYKGRKKQYSAEEILSMVITKMKESAEAFTGRIVKNAVITVPAYFNDCQRQATKNAAINAGLNVMRMVNEPTAAAIAYGMENRSGITEKRNVIVFDLGGRTFDVSLVTISNGGKLEVKYFAGDTHLGGEYFDNNLVNCCVQNLTNKWNKDITGNKRALGRLKDACERAKRDLSRATTTSIYVHSLHDGIDFEMYLSRAKFEDLNMDYFKKCIRKLETCLMDAKMGRNSVDDVILVGGSTMIPKVRCMLQDFFGGKELCKSINPTEVVAYGAAVMAAMLCHQSTTVSKELVPKDVVTPLSLGLEIYGELMCVVVPRNTPIPTKKAMTLCTKYDNQSSMKIKICEGERTRSTNNYILGEVTLSKIPPASKGCINLTSIFEIDANGILTVTSKVVSPDYNQELTVTIHTGILSRAKTEIEKMVKDAEKYKDEDQKYKRKIDAYNELEDCLNVMKKKMKKIGNDISPNKVLENLEHTIYDTTEWLDKNIGGASDIIEAKE